MNSNIKRRAFLGGTFAVLGAGPLFIRAFKGNKKAISANSFGEQLEKYQALANQSVLPTAGPERFRLNVAPPLGNNLKYLIFLPSVIEGRFSQAIAGEPDGFYVREGRFAVQRTDRDQTILFGGDDVAKICRPTLLEERERNAILLLAQDGRLHQAAAKGSAAARFRDSQMFNLLTLKNAPQGDLKVGMKWKADSGRVKPFGGVKTNYEIVGFSEIVGRKTVSVKFTGNIANAATFAGVREDKIEKDETMSNVHSGNAWFDLETGLLVRQETKMVSESKGVTGIDGPLAVSSNLVIQLFPYKA